MRYHVLATDYDGTVAHEGELAETTITALKKLRDTGRKIILVTGRELDELLGILEERQELFDRIVAENGAVLYEPGTKAIRLLATPPPREFGDELTRRGCERVAVGRVIVATWEPHQTTVLEVIREQGLELQVIFNKGAVMVLPSGVNKATGLTAALAELGLSPRNVVAVGDAENDHALLGMSECGVAVANALPALKDRSDLLTRARHGGGVEELIAALLRDDLRAAEPLLRRRHILLGEPTDHAFDTVMLDPYATSMVVCGTSGSGKSTVTTGILERLARGGYQFVILDPEGDFSTHENAVVLGGPKREPLVEEILDVLRDPARNVVVNLLGVALEHRPEFAMKLLPALADLRAHTGRPHWLVVDEAHHLMPASWETAAEGVGFRPHGTIYITVHPASLAAAVLSTINTVIAVGEDPDATIRELCDAAGHPPPPAAFTEARRLPTGDVLFWRIGEPHARVVRTEPPTQERTRHSRKYTEGNLGRDRSFTFTGPDGKLNLKAQNLQVFLQMGDGVDDATWTYHLERNDYSQWLRVEVKDAALADEIAAIEAADLPPAETRAQIRTTIEKRYTLPADKPSGIIDPVPRYGGAQSAGQTS